MEFIDVFVKLCNEIKKAPSAVCADLGLSNATYAYWRKHRNLPRDSVLAEIADYFDVSVDYLKGIDSNRANYQINNSLINAMNGSPNSTLNIGHESKPITFSRQEQELIDLFRGFSLEEQTKLVTYALKIKNGEE